VNAAAPALDLVLGVERQLTGRGDEVAFGLHIGILGERMRPPQDLTSTLQRARAPDGKEWLRGGREPLDDVQDVHLRECLEVRLPAFGMLVGAEPERLHGRHSELAGATHVLE
jgi:hypothetical protein